MDATICSLKNKCHIIYNRVYKKYLTNTNTLIESQSGLKFQNLIEHAIKNL